MQVPAWNVSRLVLAMVLALSLLLSLLARAPGRRATARELWRLVILGTALYVVGGIDSLLHQSRLAALVFAVGIATCSRAVWVSRGRDSGGGPPQGEASGDEEPPPDPDGVPGFDWDRFEAEFRSFSERPRTGAR